MKRLRVVLSTLAVFLAVALAGLTACGGGDTTPPVTYSAPQLQYKLLAAYPDFFWCDPDFYPIGRPGIEEQNAEAQFAETRANATEFAAILEQLGMPDKIAYTAEEKLEIYREHKLLRVVPLTAAGNIYSFSVRTGESEGQLIEGTISVAGAIRVTKRETSFNTCPICLVVGTLIATPAGQVPVEQVKKGDMVWTQGANGIKVAVATVGTASTRVPEGFQVVRVRLDDGRTVTASPRHPTTDGRVLAELSVGDELDGGTVVSVESVPYDGGFTYDLLPAGDTGYYWADGILLGSTLAAGGR